MVPRPTRPRMARQSVPVAPQRSASAQAARGRSYLYGGTAAIVGVVGLLGGVVFLLLGSTLSGGILLGLGAILLIAGFLVARYGR